MAESGPEWDEDVVDADTGGVRELALIERSCWNALEGSDNVELLRWMSESSDDVVAVRLMCVNALPVGEDGALCSSGMAMMRFTVA